MTVTKIDPNVAKLDLNSTLLKSKISFNSVSLSKSADICQIVETAYLIHTKINLRHGGGMKATSGDFYIASSFEAAYQFVLGFLLEEDKLDDTTKNIKIYKD